MKTITVNEVKQGDIFTLNEDKYSPYVVNICLRVYPRKVKVLRLDKNGSIIDFMEKDKFNTQFNLVDLSSLGAIYK